MSRLSKIYLFFLLIVIFIKYFSKNLKWAILFTIIIGAIIHENIPNNSNIITNPPKNACGFIETLMPRPNGNAFIIKINNENSNKNIRVRLTEKRELNKLPLPGDSICFEASWYPIMPPTVPGAFDTKAWLKSQNLNAYGKFIHWDSHRGSWIFERIFYQFRMWIKSRFDEYLETSETGLLLGLLAGDKSGIPEALRSDFQRSGLVHVLAISGFHVVLLAGMLMVFLKATRLSHKLVRIIAIILLFLYVPITGGSPAVRRAVLMFTIPQIGALFGRTSNTMNNLGIALLFILIPNPMELWNPGFQLSVAATAGILIGNNHNPLKQLPQIFSKNCFLKKLNELVFEPTYITLCATLATCPFLIHHFKTLSPFAWLGNIFVVPCISLGMQAGLFALISPFDIFRKYFCNTASFFLRMASLLTKMLSNSSEASLTVGPFSVPFLFILGGLFLLFPLIRKNLIAKKYSLYCLLLFSLIFCFKSYYKIIYPQWKLTMIDIEQGDSILLTSPSGKNILIDAGPNDKRDSGKDIIVPYLHHIGVLQLDAIVITHADKDHFGGLESLLRMFPVKEIWTSKCAILETKQEWQESLLEAKDRNIFIREISEGFIWKENSFEIKAIHPKKYSDKKKCHETNRESISLRIKGLKHSAVLTGDLTLAGEKEILKKGFFLNSDILKLGHHGSKTSNSVEFINKVNPKIALISSGRKNRFKHPHKEVTNRLDSLRIPYLNTATNGTITTIFTKDTMIIKTMIP